MLFTNLVFIFNVNLTKDYYQIKTEQDCEKCVSLFEEINFETLLLAMPRGVVALLLTMSRGAYNVGKAIEIVRSVLRCDCLGLCSHLL